MAEVVVCVFPVGGPLICLKIYSLIDQEGHMTRASGGICDIVGAKMRCFFAVLLTGFVTVLCNLPVLCKIEMN